MQQSTSTILMVQPAAFGFDPLSATSNSFQHEATQNPQSQAKSEFDAAVETLRTAGVNVIVAQDTPEPAKPDAVFPNNWLSTWPDGQLFLYPMCVPSRRLERSPLVIDRLAEEFMINEIVDLSPKEREGIFLESTGAIVFDHLAKVAYASVSIRCDEASFREHCTQLGYKPFILHAKDQSGVPIYHTNVLMGIQTSTAVVCGEVLPTDERLKLIECLEKNGRTIIEISLTQMQNFAGNVLEVQNTKGERLLAMSESAFHAFTAEQRATLEVDKQLLSISIPTIEQVGGGSMRCMMAEIFLPTR